MPERCIQIDKRASPWGNLLFAYANNKDTDQSAHLRSLICAFIIRCLDSIMLLVSVYKISSLCLASVTEQAGFSLTCSEIPKTGFLVTRLKQCRPRSDCSFRSCLIWVCIVCPELSVLIITLLIARKAFESTLQGALMIILWKLFLFPYYMPTNHSHAKPLSKPNLVN